MKTKPTHNHEEQNIHANQHGTKKNMQIFFFAKTPWWRMYVQHTHERAHAHSTHTHTHTHTQHGAACTFTYPGTKFACIRRVREHICIVNTSIQSTHICIGALACIRRVREHIYIENTYVSREHIYSENIYIENTHMYSYIGVHIRLVREHLYTENTYIQGTHVNREHIYTENAFCTCIVNTSM